MNQAERCLNELLSVLEAPGFDMIAVERTDRALAASLLTLSALTPRAELERIWSLHAAVRALVERRHAETGRLLDAVVKARERCSHLTRPQELRTVVDMDA